MRKIITCGDEMGRKYVTLAELADKLKLKNLTENIDLTARRVYSRSVNRPAFQLVGYYEFFDEQRLQIFGNAEHAYLGQLDTEQRLERIDKFFSMEFPAVILCRGLPVYEGFLEAAKRHGKPVLITERDTGHAVVSLINWISEQLAPTETVHGVLVDVFGEGILIMGPSGIGKSETAVELVKRGHRLVADDVIEISKISETLLMGKAPDLTKHFVELRGLGVVDVRSLYGVESVREQSPIDMIIHLEEWDGNTSYDRLGLHESYQSILDIDIMEYTVPVRPGRNLAIIIETAAVNNRQKEMGYNAPQALVDRVAEEIRRHKEEYKDGQV